MVTGARVLRVDGARERRRRDRGLPRHARRHPAGLSRRSTPNGSTRSTTASTPSSTCLIPAPTCSTSHGIYLGRAVGRVRRAGSRARRASRTCSRRPRSFDPVAQLVLCAGLADMPELGAEVERRVAELQPAAMACSGSSNAAQARGDPDPQPRDCVRVPSIYEPLGIVNLEAMACEAAVVATATGGIVEVVVDGETGFLVPIEPGDDGTGAPRDPAALRRRLRRAGQRADRRPGARGRDGRAGRQRAVDSFAWPAIAEQTSKLYRLLIGPSVAPSCG